MSEGIIQGRIPISYRVKQGCLNEQKRPEKHDYLTVYRNIRSSATGYQEDTDIMAKLATMFPDFNSADKAFIVPIRLLYDNPHLNIRTHYACYDGSKCPSNKADHTPFAKCKGNGETAFRILMNGTSVERPCPGPDRCSGATYRTSNGSIVKLCKLQGVFDFQFRGVNDFTSGIARYRTAGFNSASGILGQLQYYHKAFGILRGLPFNIELTQNGITAMDGKIYNFHSLVLSVEGEDPFVTLGKAKVIEMKQRAEYGYSFENQPATMEDITFEDDDNASDTEELTASADGEAYQELIEKEPKLAALEERQVAETEVKQDLRKAAKKAKEEKPAENPPSLEDVYPDDDPELPV